MLFFYQNDIFTHFLLIYSHCVQQVFSDYLTTVQKKNAEQTTSKTLIINNRNKEHLPKHRFLQKVSQNVQNARNEILLK